MSRVSSLGQISAIALLIGTGVASADVTSAEVWENFKDVMESNGQAVSAGSVEETGSGVVVQDMTATYSSSDGMADTTATVSEMKFTDLGDGRVEMTISPDYRVVSTMKEPNGENVETNVSMSHDGMNIIVSGTSEEFAYDVTAGNVTVTIDSLNVDGEDVDGDVSAVFTGLTGRTFTKKIEGGFDTTNNMAAETMAMKIAMADPDTGSDFKFDLNYQGLLIAAQGKILEGMEPDSVHEALKAGFYFKGNMGYQSSTFDIAVDDSGENFNLAGTSGAGVLDFNMSEKGMGYNARSFQLKMNVGGNTIPLPPMDITLEELGLGFQMPISASDESQDFSMSFVTRGLALPDALWGMLDPGAVLSRDPATLAFDVSGKTKLFADIMDDDAMSSLTSPGELEAMTLNNMEFSLAGASLKGDGGFTFDNTDMDTFDGIPKPEGSVNFKLVGANSLMDNLIEMGLLPAEEAMGVRMMIGMFARPEGDDTLVSEIGVKNGKITANGQPLPF